MRGSNMVSGGANSCGCAQGRDRSGKRRKRHTSEWGSIPGLEDDQIVILRTNGTAAILRDHDCGFAFAFGERIEAFNGKYLALEPKYRKKRPGALDILTIRMMSMLADNGIIEPQGERNMDRWMRECRVSSVSKRRVGSIDLAYRFYEDDRCALNRKPIP